MAWRYHGPLSLLGGYAVWGRREGGREGVGGMDRGARCVAAFPLVWTAHKKSPTHPTPFESGALFAFVCVTLKTLSACDPPFECAGGGCAAATAGSGAGRQGPRLQGDCPSPLHAACHACMPMHVPGQLWGRVRLCRPAALQQQSGGWLVGADTKLECGVFLGGSVIWQAAHQGMRLLRVAPPPFVLFDAEVWVERAAPMPPCCCVHT